MIDQIKTEIEKINQEIEDILKSIPKSQIPICIPLKFKEGKKQGLIQGAKMMIEDEIKFLEDLLWNNDCYEGARFITQRLTELKQLNNWLEKENGN